MTNPEDQQARIDALEAELKVAHGGEPEGLWPLNYPKYRVIRKGRDRGETLEPGECFVLLPNKHEIDRKVALYYAELCRAEGREKLADDMEERFSAQLALPPKVTNDEASD